MIRLLEVLIEHRNPQLSRPFTYQYTGQASIQKGMRVLVSFNQQSLVGYVLNVENVDSTDERLLNQTYRVTEILSVIDNQPIMNAELIQLSEVLSRDQQTPMIAYLQTMLPKSLKPSRSGLKGPKVAYEDWLYPVTVSNITSQISAKQYEVYQLIHPIHGVKRTELRHATIVKTLLEKELIRLEKKEKRRTHFSYMDIQSKPTLTQAQAAIVDGLLHSSYKVNLLHGLTGSGKTEVYLALSEHALQQGRSVLMIVPEIALTPIMVSYFLSRFGEDVALLHSELTPSEKYDEYRRIASGKARIVVGARSAIFAPLTSIGLIILDEEHSDTYKQDTLPSYHARDVAIWRGLHHQANVILGSATPSLETKARANKKVYGLFELNARINEKAPPRTTIVDLNQTELLYQQASMFTIPLIEKMKAALTRREQIILLVSRLGYAASIQCRSCRYVYRCPSCDIPLAYHHQLGVLRCHYCSYRAYKPSTCSMCQSSQLMFQGFGTEKVEEHVHNIFPLARIVRLDSDSAQLRQQSMRLLKSFQQGEADILLGTQMVAKGHDFPNVTLVGVLNADAGLNVPSYRSTERTFQLLSQVVGRTGRGQKDGEAIIQTYHPNHYVIQTGSKQDYANFYREEMMARKATQYPPYVFLTRLELASQDEALLTEAMFDLHAYLNEKIIEKDYLVGPNTPYPEKNGPFYRRRFILKFKKKEHMNDLIQDVNELLRTKRQIRFHINVDPYDI